jgi:CheY-like chemotaxis protein
VLINLAVNARDAMPDGGRLHIETAPGSPILPTAGGCVTLSVSDTGHGMDAATRARVFEPFFTTKGPGKGTGLGLSTVYGIVCQSGGWIQVESEPGRGATFRIHLPASHAPEATSGPAAKPMGQLDAPSTILLVEDQAAVREYLALVLDKRGYTVLAAGTPGEALSLLRENGRRICAVVSDVIMPEMNGPEMIRRMRTFVPQVKVLFISGYPANVLSPTGTLPDGCDYLSKPIQADDLLAKLDALIRG